MKKIITDKFLWDIYRFLERAHGVSYFLLKRPTMTSYLPGPKNPVVEKYKREMRGKRFSKLVHYLKKNNYIKVKNLEGKKSIMLTKKGISKALKSSFKWDKMIKRKDGKWVMLIFDVPAKHKKARGLLRSVLHSLDYKMFQQSVWISPFDVSDKTEKLLQIYSLDQYVKIFLIEEL